MNLVTILQRLRDDLKAWATTNFLALEEGLESLEASVDTTLQGKFSNINLEDSDSLYIVDKDNNIIAKINEAGVSSINFIVPNETSLLDLKNAIGNINFNSQFEELQKNIDTLDTVVDGLQNQFNQLDAVTDFSESDYFAIIDSNNNKIFEADETGVTSTNFIASYTQYPLGTDLPERITISLIDVNEKVENLNNQISTIESETANLSTSVNSLSSQMQQITKVMDFSDSDSFRIIDNENNKIFEVDGTGARSVEFAATRIIGEDGETESTSLWEQYEKLSSLEENIASAGQDIASLETVTENLTEITNQIDNRTASIDASEGSDSFSVVDNNNNIIATIDANGVTTTNVTLQNKLSLQVNGIYFTDYNTLTINF